MAHPNEHIREAVEYALDRGWRLQASGKSSHNWGTLLCGFGARGGCRVPVHSTPRVPEDQAEKIRHAVDRCPH